MNKLKQMREVLIGALILSACCWNSCGDQQSGDGTGVRRSDAEKETELAGIFDFHRQLQLPDGARVDILSWGAASIGGYLILLSDDSGNTYSAASGDRDGAIVECWVTDLDRDESPEIVLAMQSAGSGSYGTIVIHELGVQGNFKQISFPKLPEELSAGYMGHDSFEAEDNRIVRTFPFYQPGDPNAAPTGGIREIEYVMKDDALQVLGSSDGNQKQQ